MGKLSSKIVKTQLKIRKPSSKSGKTQFLRLLLSVRNRVRCKKDKPAWFKYSKSRMDGEVYFFHYGSSKNFAIYGRIVAPVSLFMAVFQNWFSSGTSTQLHRGWHPQHNHTWFHPQTGSSLLRKKVIKSKFFFNMVGHLCNFPHCNLY